MAKDYKTVLSNAKDEFVESVHALSAIASL